MRCVKSQQNAYLSGKSNTAHCHNTNDHYLNFNRPENGKISYLTYMIRKKVVGVAG
jgi:hypothetical protein